MQEIRRFKPSTVSRRFPVAVGFYRTCVIDGLLEHLPAEHVRRPSVPPESPTLGFTHLQFEALLTAARESSRPCDFALVADFLSAYRVATIWRTRESPPASSTGSMPGWSWSICENPLPHWGKLASVLRAGGWLVLEDGDGLLFNAEPPGEGLRGDHGALARAAQAAA